MRTFAQKPRTNQQTTIPGQTHRGQSHEINSPLNMGDVEEDSTIAGFDSFAHDFSQIPVNDATPARSQQKPQINPIAQQADRIAEQSLTQSKAGLPAAMLADWLPQTRGTGAESVPVLPASPIADRNKANAVTLGQVVHLSSGLSRLAPAEQQRVLAHEAVHVAQHSAPGPSASREMLEMEAHQLSSQVIAGHRVQPQFRADTMTPLADDGGPLPNDRIAVRKAKARREVLLRWKAVYEGSKDKNLIAEHQKILDQRQSLDDSMQKRLDEGKKILGVSREIKDYREEEQKNLAVLNRKPTTLEVTTTNVRILVRFQVRFEGLTDKEAKEKFPVLQKNLQQGISDTWNQKLKGTLLPGRTFEIKPEINFVSQTAARDDNFWLITVRPTDEGAMVYGKTKLGDAPDGLPTSVTSARLDSGVMSIPPSHINKPDILGHETLHLFGLADRYLIVPKVGEFGLRDTKGRQDPLGADEETGKPKGKILEEDLSFVLDQYEIYPTIPYNEVLVELKSVEKIIQTGRDPNSMINKRKDFNDKVIKQAEDLD
jgi:hypothetical protein